jgi:Cu(I)/Ag(I) efflux system membrane fusion protein
MTFKPILFRATGPGLALIIALGLGLVFSGCKRSDVTAPNSSSEKTLYTCGMHPQVIQEHPGNCPICGMKLTPVRKQPGGTNTASSGRMIKYYKSTMNPGETSKAPGKDSMGMDMVPVYEDGAASSDAGTITIDPATTQNMGLRTAPVMRGHLRRTIRTLGEIDFDETSLIDVTTKFRGWIEKLYVDASGKQVHAGEPLFDIYSPELYSAQVEYLLALDETAKGLSSADSLKRSALTKLTFFDISDGQIAELTQTKTPKKTMRVNAPRDGIVVEKMAVHGQMVEAGMRLYRLGDLSLVWVISQVYEQDLPFLKLGQEATVRLSYLSDREFRGRVTYIYPTVDEKTRTIRVRMEFHNPGFFLKPGMFATVALHADLDSSALLVPDSAVLRSGERDSVFVARDGGKFLARTVNLGPRGEDNTYQVVSGLEEGDRVVVSGQFLLDSESQLREAIAKMGGTTAEPATSEPASAQPPKPTETNNVVAYICPMPEHVAIR